MTQTRRNWGFKECELSFDFLLTFFSTQFAGYLLLELLNTSWTRKWSLTLCTMPLLSHTTSLSQRKLPCIPGWRRNCRLPVSSRTFANPSNGSVDLSNWLSKAQRKPKNVRPRRLSTLRGGRVSLGRLSGARSKRQKRVGSRQYARSGCVILSFSKLTILTSF